MTQKCAITPNEHVFLVKQEHKHSYQIITTCLGCGQLFVQCIFTVTNFWNIEHPKVELFTHSETRRNLFIERDEPLFNSSLLTPDTKFFFFSFEKSESLNSWISLINGVTMKCNERIWQGKQFSPCIVSECTGQFSEAPFANFTDVFNRLIGKPAQL